MKRYNILFTDGSVSEVILIDPAATIEEEIAKWGQVRHPSDFSVFNSPLVDVFVVSITEIKND